MLVDKQTWPVTSSSSAPWELFESSEAPGVGKSAVGAVDLRAVSVSPLDCALGSTVEAARFRFRLPATFVKSSFPSSAFPNPGVQSLSRALVSVTSCRVSFCFRLLPMCGSVLVRSLITSFRTDSTWSSWLSSAIVARISSVERPRPPAPTARWSFRMSSTSIPQALRIRLLQANFLFWTSVAASNSVWRFSWRLNRDWASRCHWRCACGFRSGRVVGYCQR